MGKVGTNDDNLLSVLGAGVFCGRKVPRSNNDLSTANAGPADPVKNTDPFSIMAGLPSRAL